MPAIRYEPWQTTTAYYDICEVLHHYDGCANHRIEIKGRVSPWFTYAEIATLKHEGTLFAATTEYFWPELPEIFIIEKLRDHDVIPPTEEEN